MVKGCELIRLESLFGSRRSDDGRLVDNEKSEEPPAGFSTNMIIPKEFDATARKPLNDNVSVLFSDTTEKKNNENLYDASFSSLRQHRSVDGNSTGPSRPGAISYNYYN